MNSEDTFWLTLRIFGTIIMIALALVTCHAVIHAEREAQHIAAMQCEALAPEYYWDRNLCLRSNVELRSPELATTLKGIPR